MKPYRCSKCGNTIHILEGHRRKCSICRPRNRREWRENNSEYAKDYYDGNREQLLAQKKKQYDANRQKYLGMQAAYRQSSPEVGRQHRDKRRDKEKTGDLTRQQVKDIVKRDKGKCIYCRTKVRTNVTPSRLRGFDHLIHLLSVDGEHSAWNLAVCCTECNADKNTMSFIDYITERNINHDFSMILARAWGDIEDD